MFLLPQRHHWSSKFCQGRL